MKRVINVIVLAFMITGCYSQHRAKDDRIGLEKIEELFNNMKSNGVNTETKMLYGYFFTNHTRAPLESVAEQLKKENYKFVDIHLNDDNLFWLHMEKVEQHNPKSLFALNEKFYQLAEQHHLDSYDGFDVGNPDSGKPIERDTYMVPEEFKNANFTKDGHLYLLIVNTAFRQFPHKSEFCHFIKVTTRYKSDDESLLPGEKELDELDAFEYFVENNLKQNGIKSYYVFRDTHAGLRHFYLVTNTKKEALDFLQFLKSSKNNECLSLKY